MKESIPQQCDSLSMACLRLAGASSRKPLSMVFFVFVFFACVFSLDHVSFKGHDFRRIFLLFFLFFMFD